MNTFTTTTPSSTRIPSERTATTTARADDVATREIAGIPVATQIRAGYKACSRGHCDPDSNHAEGLVGAPARPAAGTR